MECSHNPRCPCWWSQNLTSPNFRALCLEIFLSSVFFLLFSSRFCSVLTFAQFCWLLLAFAQLWLLISLLLTFAQPWLRQQMCSVDQRRRRPFGSGDPDSFNTQTSTVTRPFFTKRNPIQSWTQIWVTDLAQTRTRTTWQKFSLSWASMWGDVTTLKPRYRTQQQPTTTKTPTA